MKKSTSSLVISHLFASVDEKEILHGLSLAIPANTVHAIMGPNGSGKSTLASVLMGSPAYQIPANSKSSIRLNGEEILDLSPEERALRGLFLAFQSPIAIAGVSIMNLLRTAYQEIHKETSKKDIPIQNPVLSRSFHANGMTIQQFVAMVKQYAKELKLEESFLQRSIHEGFSGGEKKKLEMLQALVLAPKYAVFDEIDTGLDVDALKIVAHGIEMLKKQGTGVIIITHYQRILSHLTPDEVHILVKGKLVLSGGQELSKQIEEEGYAKYLVSKNTK